MTEEIRIGIIGLGGICRDRHIPGFKKIPGVRILAVANRTRPSAERAACDYNIPVVCERWEEIIALDDINTVLIGTWPYLHCPASVAALEAGKHVFCQARMAMNAGEAERMHSAAMKSGRVAGLCPVPIGMSVDRAIARILANNEIGALRYVGVRSFSNVWADAATPMTWRKDHRLSGLNMQTLGMYIEVVHRWFGWTRLVSAETFLYTPQRRETAGGWVDVHIPDQVVANTIVGDTLPVQYVISGVSSVLNDVVEIHGERGALLYDVNKDVLFSMCKGALEPVPIGPDEKYDVDNWSVEEDFACAVREGVPYHPDFEDGMRYMQVIQAMYDSAESGERITVSGV